MYDFIFFTLLHVQVYDLYPHTYPPLYLSADPPIHPSLYTYLTLPYLPTYLQHLSAMLYASTRDMTDLQKKTG